MRTQMPDQQIKPEERKQNFLVRYSASIAELLVLILLLIIISQTLFLSQLEDVILSVSTFSIAALIGAFLVYSVRREASSRRESDQLARYLRSANKKLTQLDRLKSEFIYIATHQMRTPLTAIRGYLSMIKEGDYGEVPDKLEKPINAASDSSKDMVDTIEYFLDVTRIERGKIDYDKKQFDMKSLIRHVSDQMGPVVGKAGLSFHVDIDQEKEYPVHGDYGKLKHVLINLIDNAVHYTEEGSVTVHLWRQEGQVKVEVEDTGIGLSDEDRERIFTKFGRAVGAEKQNVFGAGLGLYIAKHVVEGHNGEIEAFSKGRGFGSTFVVSLPHAERAGNQSTDDTNA